MKNYILPLFILLIALSSCEDDDGAGSLEVVFKGSYDGSALVTTQSYPYSFDQNVQLSRVDFFVSNLELVRTDGSVEVLSDLEFVDLSFSTQSDAEEGFVLTFENVPARRYQGIRFGIGVDPVTNAMVPADFPPENPLSNTGLYWHAWNSYVFARTEGNLDTLDNGISEVGLGWLYHTGTDPLYVQILGSGDLVIADAGTITLTCDLDCYALLGMPSDAIDIKSKPINHNPLDTNEIQTLVSNYSKAFSFVVE